MQYFQNLEAGIQYFLLLFYFFPSLFFPLSCLGFLTFFLPLVPIIVLLCLALLLGYLLSHRAVTQTTTDQLAAELALRA